MDEDTYSIAFLTLLAWINASVSTPKVEKVVYEPQNPIPNKYQIISPAVPLALSVTRKPNRAEPDMLANQVPKG